MQDAPLAAPLLSIVTVCFNSARTIGETLDSVDRSPLAASRRVEHLIVDGASTDATLAIVDARPAAIRRRVSEPDTGIYSAMNKGLRLARGDYVWFLNSDDLLHSQIGRAWPALESALKDRAPQVLVGEIEMFKDGSGGPRRTRYWRVPADVARARRFSWHPPHPAFIARRRLLLELGGFDESKRIAADFKLMTEALRRSGDDIAVLPQPLVAMREGGVSNRSVRAIFDANRECYGSLRELGMSHGEASLGICLKLMRKVAQKFVSPRLMELTH
jgi:glycosyltransferase